MKKFCFAIGYMVIVIFERYIIVLRAQPCVTKTENPEMMTAECIKQKIETIPANLDQKIKKLTVSSCTVTDVNENSFKPYSNLEILIIENVILKNNVTDKYVFRPLSNLKEVYLKNTYLVDASTFFWPESIQILNISECYVTNLDLTNTINLKSLDASTNDLSDIPKINEVAEVEYVNLRANPLDAATVASLARLCRVVQIDFLLTQSSRLKTQTLYCTCKSMLDWMARFKIKSNINTEDEATGFRCSQNVHNDTKCDEKTSTAALKTREECLSKTKSTHSKYLIPIIVGSIVLILLLLLLFAYMYGSLKKEADMEGAVDVQQGPASAEESVAEEEPPSPSSEESQDTQGE